VSQGINIEKAALILAFIVAGTMIVGSAMEPHWEKVTSPDGSFTILMPRKPKVENQSVVGNGMRMETHSFVAWSQTDAEYTFSYADSPILPTARAGEKMLDAQRRSLTQGDDSRMLSAEKLTVEGSSVRLYKAIVEGGSQADEKIYLVRRRLYILLVVHDRGKEDENVKKFFDSFTFRPRE
jgi:hypothetical protein